MPLYEYECDRGHRFERIVKFSDPPIEACPECGAPVHKLMSSPAIQFKGTGWYITDYARKSGEGTGGKGSDAKPAGEAKKESTDTKDTKETKSEKPTTSDAKPSTPSTSS